MEFTQFRNKKPELPNQVDTLNPLAGASKLPGYSNVTLRCLHTSAKSRGLVVSK
jgi:hypothetical protein